MRLFRSLLATALTLATAMPAVAQVGVPPSEYRRAASRTEQGPKPTE